MKNLHLLIVCYLLFSTILIADIINVPADTSTIQGGVFLASDSDTVIVAEGTYYENVRIEDKALTLASYFLIDDDTSHISKTIIDGSQPENTDNASVISFLNSPDANVLCGFTITGGYGNKAVFGGKINRGGGGIIILGSSASIINNHIINNAIDNRYVPEGLDGALGGGILLDAMGVSGLTLNISTNLIASNSVASEMTGGGAIAIAFYYKDIVFDYIIEDNIITNNSIRNTDAWKAMGGGIFLEFYLPTMGTQIIRNNIISNNQAKCSTQFKHSFGGGLYFIILDTEPDGAIDNDPGPYIYNNIIQGNHSDYLGGGIAVWRANYTVIDPAIPLTSVGNYVPKPSFINNTIVNNTAQDGSGFYIMNHIPFLMNNILWNDHPEGAEWGEVFLGDEPQWTESVEPNRYGGAEIYYTDIQGGWDKGTGNTKVEPMFTDAENSDFHLLKNSPGIGWGVNSVTIDTIQYFAPRFDFDGFQRPNPVDIYFDMGAYELPYAQTEPNSINENYYISKKFTLSQNYPNPFNPRTIINYELPITNYVDLSVFNLLGQNVATLVNEHQQAGYHQVEWDASGFASGIYYYRIEAGNFTETRKMIYLK
jgi:hypothetical protein